MLLLRVDLPTRVLAHPLDVGNGVEVAEVVADNRIFGRSLRAVHHHKTRVGVLDLDKAQVVRQFDVAGGRAVPCRLRAGVDRVIEDLIWKQGKLVGDLTDVRKAGHVVNQDRTLFRPKQQLVVCHSQRSKKCSRFENCGNEVASLVENQHFAVVAQNYQESSEFGNHNLADSLLNMDSLLKFERTMVELPNFDTVFLKGQETQTLIQVHRGCLLQATPSRLGLEDGHRSAAGLVIEVSVSNEVDA